MSIVIIKEFIISYLQGIIGVARSVFCFCFRKARYSTRSNLSTASYRGVSAQRHCVILDNNHERVRLNLSSERQDISSTPI